MDSKYVCSLFTLLVWFFFFLCMNYTHVHGLKQYYSVKNYDAIPDGKRDNTKAFLSAWNAACGARGGILWVPSGGAYIVSGATFQGPCNGTTFFRIDGTVRATPGAHSQDFWLSFYEIVSLRIYGTGIFDGYGQSAWMLKKQKCTSKCPKLPTSIRITKVSDLIIKHVTSLNSKEFHFHIVICEKVRVKNVRLLAPGDSPNTDGIHVARSTDVRIVDSLISTGDDCVSIGDGSVDITVDSVTCGPGHGISIGSLGRYSDEEPVRGIVVRNCNLTDTTNGLRIKTFASSSVSTLVSNVTFENIFVTNVRNPIIVDQYYCLKSDCSHPEESEIKIDGVKFINVQGTSSSTVAVDLQCSKSAPCENVVFEGLGITTVGGESTAAVCSSANYKFVDANQDPRTCGQPLEIEDNGLLY